MNHRLEHNLLTNQKRYFFSLLGPRYEAMNGLMAASLKRRFGFQYEPIRILMCRPNTYFSNGNYIVLNKKAEKFSGKYGEDAIILQEYEDLNDDFSHSPFIGELVTKLFEKQGPIPVYPFTTSFLTSSDPRLLVIGPSSKVATHYDDKTRQYELFSALDLPRNKASIFENKELLRQAKHIFPIYLTAAYASGGSEGGIVPDTKALEDFLARLRPINDKGRFLVSSVFDEIAAMPNVNALVTQENITNVLVVSDQIMRGNMYLGNIYPSSVSEKIVREIRMITEKIGDHLSREGYRGLFGCDFLVGKDGRLAVIDLNPRRQGGYICNALALKSLGIDLTDIELSCALGEAADTCLEYDKIQYQVAWAHSKVKPYESGKRICCELKQGDAQQIFSEHHGSYTGLFYTKGSVFVDGYVGHAVTVGDNPETLSRSLINSVDHLLTECLL